MLYRQNIYYIIFVSSSIFVLLFFFSFRRLLLDILTLTAEDVRFLPVFASIY